jgi:hypothetical protein
MTEERVAELNDIAHRGELIVQGIEQTKTLIGVIEAGGDVDFTMVISPTDDDAKPESYHESISTKARGALRESALAGLQSKLKLLERELKNLSE